MARRKSGKSDESMEHYRGWTMVEKGRHMIASKDGTKIQRVVCRAAVAKENRARFFRAKVDEVERELSGRV